MTARADIEAALFSLQVQPERDSVRITLAGELDLATVDELDAEVGGLLDRGFGQIVLDLRGLTFIDSSGIHELLKSTRAADRRGARLDVVFGPGAVARAVELCGVRDQLNVGEAA